jgi:pimeloyl-ACP methyl ester carboxylesterase
MSHPIEKPLALLIPGLDGTGRLYYRQVDALSIRYRVRAWEFRPRDAFDLPDLAGEVAQGSENEEPGSILVVGESFGGLIALQFALDYPSRIQRLALINTFSSYRRKVRIRIACRLAGVLQRSPTRKLKEFVVDRILANEGIPGEDRRLYREAIKNVYHAAYCRRLQLVRDVDLRSRLREITVPTDLFASGRDKLVPSIKEARFMHSVIPGSKIHEFPQAGHSLLMTPGFDLADYL